jgi:hypothetical protein
MTHDLAIDAERLSIQLLKREKRVLGQGSVEKDYKSLGEYVRHLIQIGLEIEDPTLAAKYKAARLTRYSQALALSFVTTLVIWQTIIGGLQSRTAPRPLNSPRPVRREIIA